MKTKKVTLSEILILLVEIKSKKLLPPKYRRELSRLINELQNEINKDDTGDNGCAIAKWIGRLYLFFNPP